ncbi:DUF433 domain-containing protein [Chitinophaga pendula]|uniref:DUF433 domain-containing protein n=1 Tax=Chitinophaga TaxID=79328 RepID=UPI000BAEEBAA|nr:MULTISPECIES: DUF433 domain-containing protein [Chitinophaga]ASZ10858.1 hypothetical protein CK934_07640 [Chitinophaga sp. MD30]UCJ06160.1 DUF433 domain-containing protein [Chitinophaga pendula]
MDFVERNANRGFGQPVIKGRRLTVFSALSHANYAISLTSFLEDFELSLEELVSAVSYCKNRVCHDLNSPTDQYCDGCILRSISSGWKSIKDDFVEKNGVSISRDGKIFFLGSLDELEESEFGIMGWLLAERVEKRLHEI